MNFKRRTATEERDRLRGYDIGANSYVRKPVDFVQFTDAVGNWDFTGCC